MKRAVDLLTFAFDAGRNRAFWERALTTLQSISAPDGYPKLGYLLEDRGTAVGIILLIFSARIVNGVEYVRCNASSLYVAPDYRPYAAVLLRRALRFKQVTYLNLTPGPHTLPMLRAQGYRVFARGHYVSVPALASSPQRNARVVIVSSKNRYDLHDYEATMLKDHLAHAHHVIAILCQEEGEVYPFMFSLRCKFHIPLAHLVYCRDQSDFVRFGRAIGRTLLKMGYPLVVADTNGPVRLPGYFFESRPMYCLGPEEIQPGDIPYTERVLFGY